MKKNSLRKIGATSIVVMSLLTTSVFASTQDFGAAGASDEETFTLEAMLQYAIEDEYLAHGEYELIINELGAGNPFTNIIKSEETHIAMIEGLYNDYGLELPEVNPSDYLVLPESIEAALEAAVQAEINNIAMYESFLNQDLPEDVRIVFEYLQKASESHLAAFEGNNGNSRGNGSRGNQGTRGSQGTRGNQGSRGNTSGTRQFVNQIEDCLLISDSE